MRMVCVKSICLRMQTLLASLTLGLSQVRRRWNFKGNRFKRFPNVAASRFPAKAGCE